jgi:hypothetical protein
MSVLLTPARTENPRGLSNDTGDLLPKRFVVIALGIDSLYTDVGAEMNGVTATAVRPAQSHLQRNSAIGKEYARQARACVREGELSRAAQHICNLSDRPSELVCNLHRVGLGTELAWKHITQLKLHCMTHASQLGDLAEP